MPTDFLVLEETSYDILIGLPTMIQLLAYPDYYRMVLKIHYAGDSEILNHEYKWDSGNTSEYEFTSDGAEYDEHEEIISVEELVLMLNEPQENSTSKDEIQMIEKSSRT